MIIRHGQRLKVRDISLSVIGQPIMITNDGNSTTTSRYPILTDFVNLKNRMILYHSEYKHIKYDYTTTKTFTRKHLTALQDESPRQRKTPWPSN